MVNARIPFLRLLQGGLQALALLRSEAGDEWKQVVGDKTGMHLTKAAVKSQARYSPLNALEPATVDC